MSHLIFVLLLLTLSPFAYSIKSNSDWYNIDGHQVFSNSHLVNLGSKSFYLASYTYLPAKKPKATFITVHGYLVNCHYLKPIHEYLVKKEYKVVCIEMPGLGSSTGERAVVESFEIYQEYINLLPAIEPNPDYLLVHSTGAVGVLENLFEKKPMPYKHIFLVAPLVRSQSYGFIKFAHRFAKYFVDGFSRDPKDANYKSEELNQLHHQDPYWVDRTPVSWIGHLIKWNNKLETEKSTAQNSNVSIFYGGDDGVVDTPYNSNYLKTRLPKAKHYTLKGASHYPFWDPKISNEFFTLMSETLK